MANNNFKVFAYNKQFKPNEENIELFKNGIKKNTIASSESINTVLQEVSLITYSLLEILKNYCDKNIEIKSDFNIDDFVNNIKGGFGKFIDNKIQIKEDKINSFNSLKDKIYEDNITLEEKFNTISGGYGLLEQALDQFEVKLSFKQDNLTPHNLGEGVYLNGNKQWSHLKETITKTDISNESTEKRYVDGVFLKQFQKDIIQQVKDFLKNVFEIREDTLIIHDNLF